jgi:hypothetical protein
MSTDKLHERIYAPYGLYDGMALAVARWCGWHRRSSGSREHSMAAGPTDLPGYAQGLEPTAAVAGSIPAAPAG